jgi:hypothetical protein
MHNEQPTVSSSQKVKVKASSDAPQLPEISPHVSLHPFPISKAVRGETHNQTLPQVAGSTEDLSWFSFRATLTEPFDQPNLDFLASIEAKNAANRPANGKRPEQQDSTDPSSQEERSSSSMSSFSFEVSPKSQRYYAQALSTDDKQALILGTKNHNLIEWSAKDLVTHHESRKALVPRIMPKVDKTNALAAIEHDKQDSQRALTEITDKVRKVFRIIPRIKVTNADPKKEEEPTWLPAEHWADSSLDLRQALPMPPPDAHRSSHIRAASSGDYFSTQPPARRGGARSRPSPLASSSSGPPSSDCSTTRVRSPLAQELQFRANPDMTFDSFLVPVKEGHKTKLVSPEGSPKVVRQSRLSKMPSMPLLRRRSSERDEEEE